MITTNLIVTDIEVEKLLNGELVIESTIYGESNYFALINVNDKKHWINLNTGFVGSELENLREYFNCRYVKRSKLLNKLNKFVNNIEYIKNATISNYNP